MFSIAERFSIRTTKEFGQFLFIAKGSVAEVQSQLHVVPDEGSIKKDRLDELSAQGDEVARLFSGLIRYLLNRDKSQESKQLKELK